MSIVNMDMLSNPFNWIIVFLMLAVGYYALSVVLASGPFSSSN